jgi:hypothetical protein
MSEQKSKTQKQATTEKAKDKDKEQATLKIRYAGSAKASLMSQTAIDVLHEVCETAKVTEITISSIKRTVQDQARIMYRDIQTKGIAYPQRLYGKSGRAVADVYEEKTKQGLSEAEIRMAMILKMEELGPGTISHHIDDEGLGLCVFDIAPSSVVPNDNKDDLATAIAEHKKVQKFLQPPRDVAFHLEIKS